ncbi:MAG: hypothetical protein DHS20C12_28110 [Pseudohongiella sp.]|nr:MAG: hypothetical protein DHS20C12_28110 [Pseudohongiella sp.]
MHSHNAKSVCVFLALFLNNTCIAQSIAEDPVEAFEGAIPVDATDVTTALEQTLEDYQAQLAQSNGVYNETSKEIHLGMAAAYTELGNLEEAANSLNEALQAERVNGGLYSAAQLRILELSLSNAIQREQWQKVDDFFQLRGHLASKVYPPADPRYAELRSELADWSLVAYQLELIPSANIDAVQQAVEIYDDIAENLAQQNTGDIPRLVARTHMMRGIAYYHSAIYADGLSLNSFFSEVEDTQTIRDCVTETVVIRGRPVTQTKCTYTDVPNPGRFTDRQRQKLELIDQSIRAMHSHLRSAIEIVEADPGASVTDRALAHLALADAEFRTGNLQRANLQYRQVGDIMNAHPNDEVHQLIRLDKPGKLFSQSYSAHRELLERVLPTPTGILKFDISRSGEISNMVINGGRADRSPENVERVSKHFSYIAYRPAIVDGRAVASSFEGPASEL